jgi:hypothetical protein
MEKFRLDRTAFKAQTLEEAATLAGTLADSKLS